MRVCGNELSEEREASLAIDTDFVEKARKDASSVFVIVNVVP